MGSEWKSKNEKGWLSSAGQERGSDGAPAVTEGSPQVTSRVSLGVLQVFFWLFRALRARDLLCSPPEGTPAVTQEKGLLCSACSGPFWGSSFIYKSLIQIILLFFTQIYLDIPEYRYIYI